VQPLDRLGDLRPLLLRPARVVERLPQLVHEELDERARRRLGGALHAFDRGQRGGEGDAPPDDLLGGAQQCRARDLERAVAEGDEHAELLRLRERLRVLVDGTEALLELGERDDLRGLDLERHGDRAPQTREALGPVAAPADEPLDRVELETLGLHLLDEAQPVDVGAPVEARARAHLRRRQEATGLVVADVPDRHPDLVGELFDRHRVLLRHAARVQS
jgi:hypothetical protein